MKVMDILLLGGNDGQPNISTQGELSIGRWG